MLGPSAGRDLSVAAAAAGSTHEGADLTASEIFCVPVRRNGGARRGAVPARPPDPVRLI